MAKVGQADRVLEVGCGPGFHSLMLANTFLKRGAVLVSCDISKSMIQKLAEKYESSTYIQMPLNKCVADVDVDFSEKVEGELV